MFKMQQLFWNFSKWFSYFQWEIKTSCPIEQFCLYSQPTITCSKLTIEILEYFTPCSGVSIVNFEQVIAGGVIYNMSEDFLLITWIWKSLQNKYNDKP